MNTFLEWITLKIVLHTGTHMAPYVSEGDLWWCSLGQNIGTEIAGKGDRFTRPVLILKKFDRNSFLVIPITSTQRKGTWYAPFTYKDRYESAILVQARYISYQRLHNRLGKIPVATLNKIRTAYIHLILKR